MTITDSSKRPTERIKDVLREYFVAKGYQYKKSLNEFSKIEGNRKDFVCIWSNKTGNLVSATFSWGNYFSDIDSIYKEISAKIETPHNSKITIWTDLLNYFPRNGTKQKALFLRKIHEASDFPLYHNDTFEYTDASINSAADELIKNYEVYIAPFLEHYKSLRNLEMELNNKPLNFHLFTGYAGKHITYGLVLSKLFDNDYILLTREYRKFISEYDFNREFKGKMLEYLDRTIAYLESVDIKMLLKGYNYSS